MCTGILQCPGFWWGTWACGSMFHRSWVHPHSPLSFSLCTPLSIMFRNNLPLPIVSLEIIFSNGLGSLIYLFKVASLSIPWSCVTISSLPITSLDHNSMEGTKTKWWMAMWLNSTGQNIELHLHVCVLVSCNVLDSDEVHGDIVQCFSWFQFSQIGLYHLVFVPSIELWSRQIMRKEQIVAPDYEIEREATLHIYIRELKP